MSNYINIGDVVLWRDFDTCTVLAVRDGLLKIQPYCNAYIWTPLDDVRIIRRAVRSWQ